MESLKNDTDELIYKTEANSQTLKKTYGYQRGEVCVSHSAVSDSLQPHGL